MLSVHISVLLWCSGWDVCQSNGHLTFSSEGRKYCGIIAIGLCEMSARKLHASVYVFGYNQI